MKKGSIVLSLATSIALSGLAFSTLDAKEAYGPKNVSPQSLKDPTKQNFEDVKNVADVENKKDAKAVAEEDAAVGAQKKGFQLGDLNPIRWIFKPVTDMQDKVVHLEKQIVRLEGPISGLQKPMVEVRTDMVGVQGQLKGVTGDMGSVDKRLGHVEKQLDKMYQPIVELKQPVQDLAEPIRGLREQLNMILTAVLVVGVMICVGTPVVALFAFRYRVQIMKMLAGEHNAKKMAEDTCDSRKLKSSSA
ncbi:MAG: hypothetical protein SFY67_18105 [Candidatus Melainabacteria bacterium]|nr:hypothetical protein [Candidatus Melainabacteria bacterium]